MVNIVLQVVERVDVWKNRLCDVFVVLQDIFQGIRGEMVAGL